MCLFALKYTTNLSYRVFQELSMNKNKQKIFLVSALSFLHCTRDLHQYHVSLLFHMAELVFQDLTPCQGRDRYGFSSGIFTMETRKEIRNAGRFFRWYCWNGS